MFAHADLTGYEAVHAPGYPAFVALAAGSLKDVQVAQLLFGLLTTALLFLLAMRLTASPVAAFVAGALYGFNILQVQLEAAIMTEALATALLVAAHVPRCFADPRRDAVPPRQTHRTGCRARRRGAYEIRPGA